MSAEEQYLQLFRLVDALGKPQYVADTLRFTVTSSDTTVVQPLESTVVTEPWSFGAYLRVRALRPGSVMLRVSDQRASAARLPDVLIGVTVRLPDP